jgi:hypothetical protein
MTDSSVFDDSDEYVGELLELADGGQAVYAPGTGRLLAAVDADGDPLDVTDTYYDESTGEIVEIEPDPVDVLSQQLTGLERQVADLNDRPIVVQDDPGMSAEEENAAVGRRLMQQARELEALRGSEFTRAELHGLLRRAREDWQESGEVPNLYSAHLRAEAEGDAPADLDTHAGRVSWMTQRLEDEERNERLQPLDQADPGEQSYDLDSRAERESFVVDRLTGKDLSDTVVYESSDFEEEP